MKCYRIRKKSEFRTEADTEFYGTIYETLRGAKGAISNRSGYLYRYGKRALIEFEIVEYDMVEIGPIW